ncbi:hypothetical protein FACS1894122_05520 [Alphaproteobacteria bacterium]|nr:hypothetical protein FACS1894122_05520 [Alphaproteobacteria bacterium]
MVAPRAFTFAENARAARTSDGRSTQIGRKKSMEKVKLNDPIKIDGVLVHEISLRRPKVRDRLLVEKGNGSDAEKEVNFIANLASITPEEVQEIDLQDYAKIQDVLRGFLVPDQPQN